MPSFSSPASTPTTSPTIKDPRELDWRPQSSIYTHDPTKPYFSSTSTPTFSQHPAYRDGQHPAYRNSLIQPHEGTQLFTHIRTQFRSSLSHLDNLLRFLELHTSPTLTSDYRKGIDELLDNLIAMARWLVSFLMSAAACEGGGMEWTREAILGLRVELHEYSWKVMRITKLLAGRGRRTEVGWGQELF